MMLYLLPSQAGAQVLSLIVFASVAVWYVAPWLSRVSRAQALTGLLWLHVFRYVALQAVSAQQTGFPISDGGLTEIIVGDVGGALIAFATIVALRNGARVAIPLAWLLVIETSIDTVLNIRGGAREHLMGAANNVTWLILGFFVPAIVVSLVLLVWQLISRRGEALRPSGAAA
jgi:hypothetical protein